MKIEYTKITNGNTITKSTTTMDSKPPTSASSPIKPGSKPQPNPGTRNEHMTYLSLVYFFTTFSTGFLCGAIREGFVVPFFRISPGTAKVFEAPFMLVATIFWSRWLVRRYRVERETWVRIAVGGVALGVMVVIEGAGRWVRYGSLRVEGEWMADLSFLVVLVLFGVMPWVLMGFE